MSSGFVFFSLKGACKYLDVTPEFFGKHLSEKVVSYSLVGTKRNRVYIDSDLDMLSVDSIKKGLPRSLKNKGLGGKLMRGMMSPAEIQFSKTLDGRGIEWFFETRRLDTGIPCKKASRNIMYIPDFWCPEIDTYYEVSATRQAKEHSQRKINLVLQKSPKLKIIIVHPNGKEYGIAVYDKKKYITSIELAKEYSKSRIFVLSILRKSGINGQKLGNTVIYNKSKAEYCINKRIKEVELKKSITIDGKKIRALRMKYRITLKSLADFIGVNWFNVRGCETGDRIARRKELISFFSDFNKAEEIIKSNLDILTSKYTGNHSFECYYPETKGVKRLKFVTE